MLLDRIFTTVGSNRDTARIPSPYGYHVCERPTIRALPIALNFKGSRLIVYRGNCNRDLQSRFSVRCEKEYSELLNYNVKYLEQIIIHMEGGENIESNICHERNISLLDLFQIFNIYFIFVIFYTYLSDDEIILKIYINRDN